ncbi:hypothetical protein [Halocatena marina]|nr:hypothetical protein [Halocatena marina]
MSERPDTEQMNTTLSQHSSACRTVVFASAWLINWDNLVKQGSLLS